jgi:hypothetical protein
MSRRSRETSNLEALDRFWRHSPFHDESIEAVTALNSRVVIRLTELTLVVTGATNLKRCELPAVWLYESIVQEGGRLILDVETDTGHLHVAGAGVRLIRNSDLAVLIPPIDA